VDVVDVVDCVALAFTAVVVFPDVVFSVEALAVTFSVEAEVILTAVVLMFSVGVVFIGELTVALAFAMVVFPYVVFSGEALVVALPVEAAEVILTAVVLVFPVGVVFNGDTTVALAFAVVVFPYVVFSV